MNAITSRNVYLLAAHSRGENRSMSDRYLVFLVSDCKIQNCHLKVPSNINDLPTKFPAMYCKYPILRFLRLHITTVFQIVFMNILPFDVIWKLTSWTQTHVSQRWMFRYADDSFHQYVRESNHLWTHVYRGAPRIFHWGRDRRAENRGLRSKAGWGLLGREGQQVPSPQARGSEGALSAPQAGFGVPELRPSKVFPLFSALRVASPDTILILLIMDDHAAMGAWPPSSTPCIHRYMYSNKQTVPKVLSVAGCSCSEYCQRICGAHRLPLRCNTVVSCCGNLVHGRRRGTERFAVVYLIFCRFHRVRSVHYRSGWG